MFFVEVQSPNLRIAASLQTVRGACYRFTAPS
jgi:hypothetical protein